jgi:hypothetical protein
MIPMISTAAVGPLGIMHLPRFWLKLLLHGLGRLPPDYKYTTGTFDRMLIDALALDEERAVAFVRTVLPDYLQFEQWIRANAKPLDDTEIATLNARYRAATMSAAAATLRREQLGLRDDALCGGILLNDLDDWSGFRTYLIAEAGEG